MPLYGFFAHMEWETEEGRAALRLLLDCEMGLFPFPVRLDADALGGAVSQATDAAGVQSIGGGRFSDILPEDASADLTGSLEPLVSLVLFLCGEDADIGGHGCLAPGESMPKQMDNEHGRFDAHSDRPLETICRWRVGSRIGVDPSRSRS